AASCPAGPAFEGGAITCGMPALDGAIEDVAIDDATGDFKIGVIGGGAAQGICGSGLVDLMSELLRTDAMNDMGRFDDGAHRVTLHDPARSRATPGDKRSESPDSSSAHSDVYFTESDVNELAQAKGANVAGLQVVANNYGVGFDDLDVFYLAGGFGRHLKVEASKRIGLIPNIADAKIVRVGNAAIEGACIALLSKTKRAELETLVRKVEHCRLETHPRFFDFFVEGCQFKPVESAAQEVGLDAAGVEAVGLDAGGKGG
ncbi:MAG: ASKHA domain-containing protein, partial [Tepidisphaeraceae bacterium]